LPANGGKGDIMKKIISLLLFLIILCGCQLFKPNNPRLQVFHSGLVAVEKDNKWEYIGKRGNVKIEFLYDGAAAFYDDLAIVKANEQMILINKVGKNVLDKSYDALYRCYESGNLWYYQNNKWGLMNMI